ncbi:MAG: hypothetical protein ACYSTY_03285 [Planctomycetota bacterium]|jgi:hypothetical protein
MNSKANYASAVALAAGLGFTGPVVAQDDPGPTSIWEVVLYAIDDGEETGTYMVRYAFSTQTESTVGYLVTTADVQLYDCESLAWIPSGPHQGMYTIPVRYEHPNQLIKVNPLNGRCEVMFDHEVGYHRIVGMTPIQNPVTSDWYLLAVTNPTTWNEGDEDGDGDTGSWDKYDKLIMIDPETGTSQLVQVLGGGQSREGLAIDRFGEILTTRQDLLNVLTPDMNPPTYSGNEVTINDFGYGDTEALTFCHSDDGGRLEVPDYGGTHVPAGWTQGGVLFAYSSDELKMLILNPNGHGVVEYPVINLPDGEGLVALTELQDPLMTALRSSFD